jgi:hypothetical protein
MDPTTAPSPEAIEALTATSIAQVDELDPVVAVITWALTALAAKYAVPDKLRALIPVLAILVATGLVAGLQASQGEPLSFATVIRGFGAGAAAIAGHSGFRELFKKLTSDDEADEDKTPEVEEEATDPGVGEE